MHQVELALAGYERRRLFRGRELVAPAPLAGAVADILGSESVRQVGGAVVSQEVTMALFGRRSATMPDPGDALPGRAEAMPVAASHLVLGTPMVPPFPENTETLILGMGCFWGVERIYWEAPGVYTTACGYSGGYTPNPTYGEVCTGGTGHNEVVLVVYDTTQTDLEALLTLFWENHDPTQGMRQGNDTGTQYRSGIYTTSEAQATAAQASKDRYQAKLTAAGFGEITTEIVPAGEFYYAENDHQQYLHKIPNGYCNHGFCQVSYKDAD